MNGAPQRVGVRVRFVTSNIHMYVASDCSETNTYLASRVLERLVAYPYLSAFKDVCADRARRTVSKGGKTERSRSIVARAQFFLDGDTIHHSTFIVRIQSFDGL